jgi:glucosamine kinase
VGVAGANVGDYGKRIEKALPFDDGRVVTDALISLQGALGDADGIVGAVGTGSVYNARREGKLHGIGGWGSIVGDQASGARLGRDLLERALLAYDKVRPRDFARYAPAVFEAAEAGDAIAIDIVREAADAIDASLDALSWPECPTICLLGGLARAYHPWLADRHKTLLAEPKADALQGAVDLAVKLMNDRQGGVA